MTLSFSHPDAEVLAAFLAGTLDEARRANVADHVADCVACQAQVRFLTRANGAIASPAAPAPTAILERAMAARDAGERRILPRPIAAEPAVVARGRRVAMGFAIAAGALVTFTGGLIVGASTSYAVAAPTPASRPTLAILPVKNALNALGCGAVAVTTLRSAPVTEAASTMQAVPIVDLAPVTVRSSDTLAGVLAVTEGSDGRVLVEETGRGQVLVFDRTLALEPVGARSVDRRTGRITYDVDTAGGRRWWAITTKGAGPNAYSWNPFGAALLPRLIQYLGDSSLLANTRMTPDAYPTGRGQAAGGGQFDFQVTQPGYAPGGATGMVVLDGRGKSVRTLALPAGVPPFDPSAGTGRIPLVFKPLGADSPGSMRGLTLADAKGRLLFESIVGQTDVQIARERSLLGPCTQRCDRRANTAPLSVAITDRADTVPIARLDVSTGRIDTVSWVKRPPYAMTPDLVSGGGKLVLVDAGSAAGPTARQVINPLVAVDDWTVLSDGTIGIVRGADYHVDWIHPDGSRSSSARLPFTWTRLTDADKRRLIDSTKAAVDSSDRTPISWSTGYATAFRFGDSTNNAGRTGRLGDSTGTVANFTFSGTQTRRFPYEIVAPSQIADMWPAIERGSAMADRDGNLWIKPRASGVGPTVYDVVHPRRGLVQRVRVPAGKTIAGFGKGGIVYLTAANGARGVTLERASVPKSR